MSNLAEELILATKTAFIDSDLNSNLVLRPRFISNDAEKGNKVLSSIEEELERCDEFLFSVAFITESGLTPLLQTFKALEQRGVRGRILTTDYLTFSEPKALTKINNLSNVDIRMYHVDPNVKDGFHTKGYIFRRGESYKFIVGSSNMTASALTTNKEWNLQVLSMAEGEVAKDVLHEFDDLWKKAEPLDSLIETYTEIWNEQKRIAREGAKSNVVSLEKYKLKPNQMQVAFVDNLKKLCAKGAERALLISATATGKTYASAFALRDQKPQRALFLVHREIIAEHAKKSYERVFESTKKMGLLSGTSKEYDAEILFATMSTMAKEATLQRFAADEFDVIVIDEVHRAGASSYQRIMNHFTPKLWLGMTASPERTDGYDIFELFDHNIAHEIRLQQAMEEDMICPFNYFGITDLTVDGKVFDDTAEAHRFADLVSDERVKHVLEQAEYYGYCGDRVKGLVFCRSKEEARELAVKFNQRGWKSVSLSSEDSQERRAECVERLASDEREDFLHYIFTVDIFNEGVDIPEVNQVIMLRPTQSPIVFVQQLGRGLRKSEGKKYVVILDFIGNYSKNFMIPLALSGDRTYNKDTIRKYVSNGSRILPGSSTIHFDEIARERIYHSIDQMKGIKKVIRESYRNLKYKLGRVPTLVDFYMHGEVDPMLIIEKYKTYYAFLKVEEQKYMKVQFSEQEENTLEYLSKIIAHGKRPHELELMSLLLNKGAFSLEEAEAQIREKHKVDIEIADVTAAAGVLEGTFVSKDEELKKFSTMEMLRKTSSSQYERLQAFSERMRGSEFSKHVNDLLELGMLRYKDKYANSKKRRGAFVLYEKYSRRDVCLLLNQPRDYSSTMYGMKRIGDDVALFVTYNKEETDGAETYLEGKPNYADEFVNNQIFMWDSQIGKGPDSKYMQDVQVASRKHLFVKKSDAEGTDFYYMGQFDIIEVRGDSKKDNAGKLKKIAKVTCKMHDTVPDDLLTYLQSYEG